jgi:Cu+-exporting ATPase
MKTAVKNICYHCGENCNNTSIKIDEKLFCCSGCKTVYQLLNDNGLCDYYKYDEHPGAQLKSKIHESKFAFLKDTEVEKKLISFRNSEKTIVTFYLPHIHCSSCIWLLENLQKLNNGVLYSEVNFPAKEITIHYHHQETDLKKLAETLTNIGYEPYLSLNQMGEKKVNVVPKERYYKLGVAGFCFANIMLLSLPEYFAGKNTISFMQYEAWFRFLNLGLGSAVFFYSASEFFSKAWSGIKEKYLNIDAPVSLAIIITFSRSLYEILSGNGAGYMDSMAGIVFFMLVGRILQDRTYRSLSFDRDFKSYFPIATQKIMSYGKTSSIQLPDIKQDDHLKIFSNEIIPVDSILIKGKAMIDYSFVTGENTPVKVNIGELIYAGGKQLDSAIEIRTVKEVSQSYLTSLWNKWNKKIKSDNPKYIDIVAKYFSVVVFFIAALTGSYWFWKGDINQSLSAITAILIVACPCVLILSSTFTYGNILRILSNNQFFVKSTEVLDELSKINHIIFDKTGTVTLNQNFNINYTGEELNESEINSFRLLSAQTQHPYSRALQQYFGEAENQQTVEHFKEHIGKGIEAWINETHVEIGSYSFFNEKKYSFTSSTSFNVYIAIERKVVGGFMIEPAVRKGLKSALLQLKDKFRISLLSGDSDSEKAEMEELFGDNTTMYFKQLPSDKVDYIAYQKAAADKVLMIGDGLNDAGALMKADVGVAITDDLNSFTPSSDAILKGEKLYLIPKFIQFAKIGKTLVLICFTLTILYNLTGIFFAVQGKMQPLIAAILMSLTSLTVLFFSYFSTKILAKKLGLEENN